MAAKSEPAPGRRQVLQVLAGGVGAGLAAPALAVGETTHAHPAASSPLPAGAAIEPAGLLDANQLETVASLAEAVVPGAGEAGVAPFVDRLLAVSTQDQQREFLAALGALEAESRERFGKPWLGLDAPQKTRLLEDASTGPEASAPQPKTLRDRFELLKKPIATAYWSSEKGKQELGWTGQMVHAAFPSCSHEGGHGTSE